MGHKLALAREQCQLCCMSILARLSKWCSSQLRWIRPLFRPPALQVAALCYRKSEDGIDVLLVQSNGRKQWILPKGWPKKNRTAAQTAAAEAFEEAGATGIISESPIGSYRYTKTLGSGVEIQCLADAYSLEVLETANDFPESKHRRREWFAAEKAAEMVSAPELSDLLQTFQPS